MNTDNALLALIIFAVLQGVMVLFFWRLSRIPRQPDDNAVPSVNEAGASHDRD